MRQIKFRGLGIDGKTYYGDLYHTRREVGINVVGDGIFEVEPESVSQLIGFDKNGNEVYEEDKVQRLETGAVFRACFSDYDGILDGEIVKV